MNKVINVQLAGQVFWLDEDAFAILTAYTEKLKEQLGENDDANDIIQDIELRIAELFFELLNPEKNNITQENVQKIISQIGYLDSDELNEETKKVSFRDDEDKIIGGVCAGLARRFQVPALVLRILFIVFAILGFLGAPDIGGSGGRFIGVVGGVGVSVVLYLILWFSLSPRKSRGDLLASEGKARTAKHFANIDIQASETRRYDYQKILFLPFTILGALIDLTMNHFQNNKRRYTAVIKHICALAIVVIIALSMTGLYYFNTRQFFRPLYQIILILNNS